MKVIFLDVDGVLNTNFTKRTLYDYYTFVDRRKVFRLRDIIERTGAQIVLSSSWREIYSPIDKFCLETLAAEFNQVRCPLWIDITPVIRGGQRWQEIVKWLVRHPEVTNYIVLDDVAEELKPLERHLVITNPNRGLDKERAELAISMLNKEKV